MCVTLRSLSLLEVFSSALQHTDTATEHSTGQSFSLSAEEQREAGRKGEDGERTMLGNFISNYASKAEEDGNDRR